MEGMVAILRDVTRRFEEVRALRREIAALKESSATSARVSMAG
jgi:AmiR/NasT family two-component response regulator